MHSDLIAKLEELDGPDPEVDAEICIALQYGGKSSEGATNVRTDPDWDGVLLFEIGNEDCCSPIPELTASIDAASALVERVLPGWSWEARRSGFGNGQASVWNPMEQPRPGTTIRADHKSSPAIALPIAALKALEARDG